MMDKEDKIMDIFQLVQRVDWVEKHFRADDGRDVVYYRIVVRISDTDFELIPAKTDKRALLLIVNSVSKNK